MHSENKLSKSSTAEHSSLRQARRREERKAKKKNHDQPKNRRKKIIWHSERENVFEIWFRFLLRLHFIVARYGHGVICELFHYKLRFGNSRTLSERRRRHRSTNAKLFSFTSLAYSHLVYDVKPLLLVQGYVDRVVVDFSYFFYLFAAAVRRWERASRCYHLSRVRHSTHRLISGRKEFFSAESTSVVNMLVLSISSSHLTRRVQSRSMSLASTKRQETANFS